VEGMFNYVVIRIDIYIYIYIYVCMYVCIYIWRILVGAVIIIIR
jgi:hypothetical protein